MSGTNSGAHCPKAFLAYVQICKISLLIDTLKVVAADSILIFPSLKLSLTLKIVSSFVMSVIEPSNVQSKTMFYIAFSYISFLSAV